jgi:hypothetical protein
MSDLHVVEQFRGELLTATVPRRRRPLWLLGGIGAVVLVTGIATAATGSFPIGDPLGPWRDNRSGKPVPHSGHLQAIRAADPAGGPPWGIRVFRTAHSPAPPPRIGEPALLHSGNGVCEQLGRVVDGKLGVIETDGRFHALPLGPAGLCLFSIGPSRGFGGPTYSGWSSTNVTSSGAPAGGFPGRPCKCAGAPRWVMGGVAEHGVVAVELAGRRYPLVDGRFLIVLAKRPHAHLMYVMRDGRVTENPAVRR